MLKSSDRKFRTWDRYSISEDHKVKEVQVTDGRAGWPLPGTETTTQVSQRVILLLLSLLFLPPHTSLPYFSWGLVLSSLKACPHTPCSSLCSLNRSLARCSPNRNTHTGKHTQRDSDTPRCTDTHLSVVVQCDCIRPHQPYIRGK